MLLALFARHGRGAPRAIAPGVEVRKAAYSADTVRPRMAEGAIAQDEQGDQLLVGNFQTKLLPPSSGSCSLYLLFAKDEGGDHNLRQKLSKFSENARSGAEKHQATRHLFDWAPTAERDAALHPERRSAEESGRPAPRGRSSWSRSSQVAYSPARCAGSRGSVRRCPLARPASGLRGT